MAPFRSIALTIAALSSALPALAQGKGNGGNGLKPIDPLDVGFWKTIRNATLSNDGRWFAYSLVPNEGDGQAIIRPTAAGGTEWRFPVGEIPPVQFNPFDPSGGRAEGLALSGDAKWAVVTTYPTEADAKKLKKDKKPLQNGAILVNLGTSERREFERVKRLAFAGEKPNWLVLQRYPAEGATAAELLLVDLRTGAISLLGSVVDYAIDESGTWLAWTAESRDLVGNGIQVRNLATDQIRILDADKAVYRQLAWADSGLALAVLRGYPDSARGDTVYSVVGINGVGTTMAKSVFVPDSDATFPAGLRISPERAPRWTADRAALVFGLTTRRAAPESKTPRPDVKAVAGTPGAMQVPASAGDDELPSLVIWHAKDERPQSQQQVEEARDKAYNQIALYRPAERKFVRLADPELREVVLTPKDRFGYGWDRRSYERDDGLHGANRRDYYAVDLTTGARTLIEKDLAYPVFSPSPDGTKALLYAGGQYEVYDFLGKKLESITTSVPTKFYNVDDDHNVDKPPVPAIGWSADSRFVLLSDQFDVWRVSATGTGATNLTATGRRDRIRFGRRVIFDPKEKGIDLAKPLYFQTYGEWTKKEGLSRVMPTKPGAEPLFFDDAKYFVIHARDADTWAYTKQTVRDFPDYWVTDGRLTAPARLTDANPQQKDYAWSAGARLVDYVSDKGDTLQAALYLPANYEPGKKYPTIVYIYEKLSQTLHGYSVPNVARGFNPSIYTSRGYAVLQPDIVYRVNDPGMSSVWCVVPAVKAAIATGIVDSAHIGLQGHSWGGYQSAFLATQTGKLFAGIVSGAPLTDMISMYGGVYWNTGVAIAPIFQTSQGRFKGSFLENEEAYIRNSPAFFADKVETPIMLLHNEKDGAVDFNQGITFYNSLKERDKNVILLQYVGENHGLALPKNQKDYTMRMQEYFDHYIRGMPAADWIENGVPRLEMEKHLKGRQQKPKPVS